MPKRTGILELAVLGLLRDSPMHGYELRKRLNSVLGTFRALSYGSLYPCLRGLVESGWISSDVHGVHGVHGKEAGTMAGKRARIVYTITAEGKEHFQELLDDAGPATWEDESFGVHLAFFRHTDAAVRLRILEGRRTRLEERSEKVRSTLSRTRERLDDYTLALQRHGLDSVEREVRWLNELIADERSGVPRQDSTLSRSTTNLQDDAGAPAGARQDKE